MERDKVVKLINSVIAKVEQVEELSREQVYQELLGLKQIIDQARADLRATNATDISSHHIPSATDELDAIVKSTEGATMSIFNACEGMEKILPGLDEHHRNQIQNEVTRIYEACSFQDLTGQRITKVVRSLRDIETKVNAILDVVHQHTDAPADVSSGPLDTRQGDARLMNGPALPGQGISQDDIDKLLADFDG